MYQAEALCQKLVDADGLADIWPTALYWVKTAVTRKTIGFQLESDEAVLLVRGKLVALNLSWCGQTRGKTKDTSSPRQAAGRLSGEKYGRQWGMCTRSGMHVSGGRHRYGQRRRWRSSRVGKREAATEYVPAPRPRSRSACWYAKRAGGGRAAPGARCAVREARRTSSLGWQGRGTSRRTTTTGCRITDCACRRGPTPAAGCRGMMGGPPQSPRRAAHAGRPWAKAVLYLPGRRRVRCSHAGSSGVRELVVSRLAASVGAAMRQRKRALPAAGECCGREASLLMSCLALLLCQRRCQPAHRALPSTCALQGVRQRRPLAEAQRDAEFHVAGCRRAVGCGLHLQQLAVAATIGAAWSASSESNYLAVSWEARTACLYVPATTRRPRWKGGVCGCP